MKPLALFLTLLLCLSLCAGCQSKEPVNSGAPAAVNPTVETIPDAEPVKQEDAAVEAPQPTTDSESEEDPAPGESPAYNEGDIDSATQDQISAMEQSSTVRDDDVAPVEASAYCKLTVSCEALLEHRDELNDVLLPPDGMFYSGTVILSGGETALRLIADKLAACGLICELEEDDIRQVAAIREDLVDGMEWVIFCNDTPLDDPDEYVIQSGDVLVLSYVLDD